MLRKRYFEYSAVLSGALMVGTGGDETTLTMAKIQNPMPQYSFPSRAYQGKPEVVSIVAPIEHLNRIEQVLSPNVSELAKMLGVSRQAVYKWKNGESIGAESVQKLEQLSLAADVFVQAGIDVPPFMLRHTVKKGQNFVELVQNGGSAVEAAQILVQLLEFGKQETAAIDAYLATKKNRHTDSIVHEFPLPFEEN